MAHGPEAKPDVADDVSIRHVLCAVDLSTAAAKALRYAAGLSSAFGAQLTALFVESAATDRPRDVGSRELTAFIMATVGSADVVHPIERQGEPIDEILSTAAALDCDLIVMGTHGRTGVQRLLLGSVAENVLRRSPGPVVIVPHAMADRDVARIDTVLCAVDFAENAERVVEYAASLATAAGEP